MLEVQRFLRENGDRLGKHRDGSILADSLASKCVGTFVGIEKILIIKIGLSTNSYAIGSMAPIPPNEVKTSPASRGFFFVYVNSRNGFVDIAVVSCVFNLPLGIAQNLTDM